jgi:uncharacterized membrane protein
MGIAGLPRVALGLVAAVVVATVAGLIAFWPTGSTEAKLADSLRPPTFRAEVVAVQAADCKVPEGEGCMTVEARLAEGPDEGSTASFPTGDTGGDPEFVPGDDVRLASAGADAAAQGLSQYSFVDYERRDPMLWLLAGFVLVVVLFGRRRGFLSLVGLAASIGVIVLFLIPAILDGRPPLAVALTASFALMLLTLALAHGVGPKSVAAALGTSASLLLTALLAVLFTRLANVTGFSSEEAVVLQDAADSLSIQGLVIAGMVIAALGVLDDVTVSQASAVLALRRADSALPFRRLYREAIDIGRDHVAATVNTLVLAYVGASLPILLVFAVGDTPFGEAVNREAVSETIVGTLVGSIGLIAAVPLTTAVAAGLAVRMRALPPRDTHAH